MRPQLYLTVTDHRVNDMSKTDLNIHEMFGDLGRALHSKAAFLHLKPFDSKFLSYLRVTDVLLFKPTLLHQAGKSGSSSLPSSSPRGYSPTHLRCKKQVVVNYLDVQTFDCQAQSYIVQQMISINQPNSRDTQPTHK